jgi:hypothetical protein
MCFYYYTLSGFQINLFLINSIIIYKTAELLFQYNNYLYLGEIMNLKRVSFKKSVLAFVFGLFSFISFYYIDVHKSGAIDSLEYLKDQDNRFRSLSFEVVDLMNIYSEYKDDRELLKKEFKMQQEKGLAIATVILISALKNNDLSEIADAYKRGIKFSSGDERLTIINLAINDKRKLFSKEDIIMYRYKAITIESDPDYMSFHINRINKSFFLRQRVQVK